MKSLQFSTTIIASREKVWETMLGPATYEKWSKAFSPHPTFIGDWKQGSTMLSLDPELGGY